MLPGSDENLRSAHAVTAVIGGFHPGLQKAEIRSAVGLGQAHRPRPSTLDERRKKPLPEFVGTMGGDRVVSALTQAGVGSERRVGCADDLSQDQADDMRQALSSVLWSCDKTRPAAFPIEPVGVLKALWRVDTATVPHASFLVSAAVQGSEFFFGKARTFLDHRGDEFGRSVLISRQTCDHPCIVKDVLQQESVVAQRRSIVWHKS